MEDIKKEVEGAEPPDELSKKIAQEVADEKAKQAEENKTEEQKKEEEASKLAAEKETQAKADKEKADAEAKAKADAEAEKDTDEEEEEAGEDEGKPKDQKRTPKLIPTWKHEAELSKRDKEMQTLKDEIATLKEEVANKSKPEKVEEIKKFAEDNNVSEDFVNGLLKLSGVSGLKKELSDKMAQLEAERSNAFQEKAFAKDYEEQIVPLLKDRAIPEDKWPEIKSKLHTLAFTEEHVNNSLKFIFNGSDDFEPYASKGKKSAEHSAGAGRGGSDAPKDPKDMTDKEFKEWSDAEGKKQSTRTFSAPQ